MTKEKKREEQSIHKSSLLPFSVSKKMLKELKFETIIGLYSGVLELLYSDGKITQKLNNIFKKNPCNRKFILIFKKFLIPWLIRTDYEVRPCDVELKRYADFLPFTEEERNDFLEKVKRNCNHKQKRR
jgi:hypothetical protein